MMIALRGSRTLGQIDTIATLISAGLQAGAATYSTYMQQSIAKMQAKTQKEIQERQAAAAAAAQQEEQQKTIEQQIQAEKTGGIASPKILGIDRDIFIIGGVGLGLVLGIAGILVGKSSGKPVPTAVNQ